MNHITHLYQLHQEIKSDESLTPSDCIILAHYVSNLKVDLLEKIEPGGSKKKKLLRGKKKKKKNNGKHCPCGNTDPIYKSDEPDVRICQKCYRKKKIKSV